MPGRSGENRRYVVPGWLEGVRRSGQGFGAEDSDKGIVAVGFSAEGVVETSCFVIESNKFHTQTSRRGEQDFVCLARK